MSATARQRRNPIATGFTNIEIHGAQDIAQLSRTMVDGWADDEDPELSVYIICSKSPLHPEDPVPDDRSINAIRLSELERLAEDLRSAIETGRRTGALPPPLTPERWNVLATIARVTTPAP